MTRKHLSEYEKAEKAVQIQNARLVCPHPWKTSYGNTSSTRAAEHMTRKTGQEWEPYRCTCRRFHIRRVEPLSNGAPA